MHGYNQGFNSIRGLINSYAADMFLIQEHWLTPHNMSRFRSDFPEYYAYGSSAMERSVEIGPLSGRPFGGTAILVENDLLSVCECICTEERFVKIGDLLCVNVYLSYNGIPDRDLICQDILNNTWHWKFVNYACSCVIDSGSVSRSSIADLITCVLPDNNFVRCDQAFTPKLCYTYVNESLNYYSKLYYFVADSIKVVDFEILDLDNNFSDHLPIC